MSRFQYIGPILLLILVGGCASVPDEYGTPDDPLEPYNRRVYRFNQAVDDLLFKPAAKGYKTVTPELVDRGVTNFFDNVSDITSAINNLLQFKLTRTGSDLGRVAVNTTVGVLGFFDVATNIGLPSYKEDLGQTFGYWGDESSPYLVLPFLGPSTLRDSIGLVGDIFSNPLTYLDDSRYVWALAGLSTLDTRADLLTAEKLLEKAALDPYSFIRDAYLQRRRDKIYDGAPPPDPNEELIFMEDESNAAADSPATGDQAPQDR